MHESSVKNIVQWYGANYYVIHATHIAEVGSYDINGSIKDFLPENIVGFDICEGPKVDVVIKPGMVPEEHKEQYSAVISANAFHLSSKPLKYKKECIDLIKHGGHFILTMCKPDCTCNHNTSPNKYGFRDGLRMQPDELVSFWDDAFYCERVFIKGHDLVYWGIRK